MAASAASPTSGPTRSAGARRPGAAPPGRRDRHRRRPRWRGRRRAAGSGAGASRSPQPRAVGVGASEQLDRTRRRRAAPRRRCISSPKVPAPTASPATVGRAPSRAPSPAAGRAPADREPAAADRSRRSSQPAGVARRVDDVRRRRHQHVRRAPSAGSRRRRASRAGPTAPGPAGRWARRTAPRAAMRHDSIKQLPGRRARAAAIPRARAIAEFGCGRRERARGDRTLEGVTPRLGTDVGPAARRPVAPAPQPESGSSITQVTVLATALRPPAGWRRWRCRRRRTAGPGWPARSPSRPRRPGGLVGGDVAAVPLERQCAIAAHDRAGGRVHLQRRQWAESGQRRAPDRRRPRRRPGRTRRRSRRGRRPSRCRSSRRSPARGSALKRSSRTVIFDQLADQFGVPPLPGDGERAGQDAGRHVSGPPHPARRRRRSSAAPSRRPGRRAP